ncbi:hypothetical protein HWI79_1209 [Cryptosporidium felis]|nr:hypothetical protein HWI79_1209 [Cryptosporidium felis]
MPPKSKGQTIQLRDLQRMAYESGEAMESILPSQSLGLERTDTHGSNRSRNANRFENTDKINQLLETDWRKGRDEDSQKQNTKSGKDRFNRAEMDDIISSTNWRDDTGRSTEKPKPELDFRRGGTKSSEPQNDPDPISFNWRDGSASGTSGFGARYGRENSVKVHVDSRPDYLKNRFKKRTELDASSPNPVANPTTSDTSSSISRKPDSADLKPLTAGSLSGGVCSVSNPPLSTIFGLNRPQAAPTSKTEKTDKKPKAPTKKTLPQKESKKLDESEISLALWSVSEPSILQMFEERLFELLTGEVPREGSCPSSVFQPGSYSPPAPEQTSKFISQVLEGSAVPQDIQSLSLIAKLSHVFTLISSSLRCIEDIVLLSQSLFPIFDYLLTRNRAGEATARLYILIETQRMASVIGNPKVDNVTGILESLWISLLKSRIVYKDTLNLWLNKNDVLAEESKFGRKNALFEAPPSLSPPTENPCLRFGSFLRQSPVWPRSDRKYLGCGQPGEIWIYIRRMPALERFISSAAAPVIAKVSR